MQKQENKSTKAKLYTIPIAAQSFYNQYLKLWMFTAFESATFAFLLTSDMEKSLQSTLVISKSKGLSEILRYIRTSTYQICRIEDKINRTTLFHKSICNLTPKLEIY